MQQTSAVRSSIASAKRSGGIEPSASGRDVDDLGAAQLLRVRDLADGRELVLADHDLRPRAARSSAETMPLTPCVTEVVTASSAGSAVQQPRERRARRLGPLDPVLPLGAVLVPAVEVLLVRRATRCESAPCEHEFR